MIRIIAAIAIYGLILTGIYLNRHPLSLGPPAEAMRRGSDYAEARPGGPALLVRPAPGREAGGFSRLPFDGAWANLLLQETGGLDITTPGELATRNLAAAALIVLPESSAGRLDAAAWERLSAFARGGGVVVAERSWPGAPTPTGPPRPALPLPMVPGLLDSLTAAGLSATHIDLYGAPVAVPADARTLVMGRPAGGGPPEPVLAVARAGAGGFVYVAFPLGRQLTVWQQGLPDEDFSVPMRWREEASVSFRQTNALVPERALLQTYFPHADTWERLLMAAVEEVHPVPRLWYFPFRFDGAYSMSHDDEGFGDRSLALTQEEARQGYRSTLFVITDRLTRRGTAAMAGTGTEIALHWWRGWSTPVVHRIGLWGWRPFRRTLSLAEQSTRLNDLRGQATAANRVHGLIWDRHYTRDFRRLEAAGYRLDSTYGPTGKGQIGYVFGTGFPFHPIDTDGRPFRLDEAPFLFQDDENWHADLDRRLVGDSQRTFHEWIVPLYHCTTMYWQPSVAVMEGWLAAAGIARAANHWVVPMEEYLRFWRSRATVALNRQPGTDSFTVPRDVPGEMGLLIPTAARLETVAGAVPDSLSRSVTLIGRTYRVVALRALGGAFRLRQAASVDTAGYPAAGGDR